MRTYKIIFIDDEVDIISGIMEAVKKLLSIKNGYDISFSVLNRQDEIDNLNNVAADIVLFDCALGAAPLNFGSTDEPARFGMELMKNFRTYNSRTKIIFYSGNFTLQGSRCHDFTNEEVLHFINDLHIYKMIPKEAKYISAAIVEAINELDAIIMSLEDLKEEYQSNGEFYVDDQLYPMDQMLEELKNGSRIGEDFRKNVIKMVLTYMMKFGGDED